MDIIVYLIVIIYMLFGFIFSFKKIKIFLGDSGSIPIGLLMGWIFLINCYKGYLFESLIICLPYFADVVMTHIFMLWKKENIFERHNRFIFQKLYFIFGKDRGKHNICYLLIRQMI